MSDKKHSIFFVCLFFVSLLFSGMAYASQGQTSTALLAAPSVQYQLIDTSAPLISKVSVDFVQTDQARISLETDETSSIWIEYSMCHEEYNLRFPLTPHTILNTVHVLDITGLTPCTTYNFYPHARNEAGLETTGPRGRFTTSGCLENAPVLAERLTVMPLTGGRLEYKDDLESGALDLTANYAPQPLIFQMHVLEKENILAKNNFPAGLSFAGQYFYFIKSASDSKTPVSELDAPAVVTLTYGQIASSDFDPASLAMYRFDSGVWQALDACTRNVQEKKISCSTKKFSVFGLFGKRKGNSPAASASSGGGGGAISQPIAPVNQVHNVHVQRDASDSAHRNASSSEIVSRGGDPDSDIDTDHDGLTDVQEYIFGTKRDVADTDGDGFKDGDEVATLHDPLNPPAKRKAWAGLLGSVRGKILLQVQKYGEAYYIHPVDSKRYYLRDGAWAYQIMRKLSLGITNADLEKIPIAGTSGRGNQALVNRLRGRILLQVQEHGEAWYLNPADGKRYYMKDGPAAYEIMRKLGLGATDETIQMITYGIVKE